MLRLVVVGVGVPALLVALMGVWLSWHRATAAIHGATQREAVTLAEMIAGNFNLATPGKTAGEAHRAVREAVHSDSLLLRDVDGLREAARGLKVPTLLVRGRLSDVLSQEGVDDFLQLVPHAEYADIAGADHMVAGDRNDAFNDAVFAFLGRHAR